MKFFEDIALGERAELGSHTYTADDIKRFARKYDPQPFHLDEAAAARSHFGALCASGWHTASVWMRLMVDHQRREDEARRGRGEAVASLGSVAGLPRTEMAQAGLCRRHGHVFDGDCRQARFQQPPRLGFNVDPQHGRQPEGRAGDLLHQRGVHRAPPRQRRGKECAMSAVSEAAAGEATGAAATKAEERRAIGVASGAHALHDGYTDLIYVMLPLWQAEFGIGFAALGLLRTCYSGTMASLQIPSALLSERLGVPLVLAVGTALSGIGYLIAGASVGFWTLVIALLIGGLGSSTQHPLASALVARAYAGPRAHEGARHLQFRGRHRQDVGAGAGVADAGGSAVAADRRVSRPARPRRGGCDLLPRAALSDRCRACCVGGSQGQKRQAQARREAAMDFRCCSRSAWSTAPPAWAS